MHNEDISLLNQNSESFRRESEDFEARIAPQRELLERIQREMEKIIVGHEALNRRLLMALLTGGHVLLEGLPGLAKTTAIKTLARVTSLDFKRIQFTPDLLPADLLGTQVYDPRTGEFKVKKGPIFAQLVLADEINRAPAKVQSALLEAMEERQISLGDKTWELDEPFLVLATQNPIEHEGTYALPEAQIDRFLFKCKLGYGSPKDEEEIIRRASSKDSVALSPQATRQDIRALMASVRHIHVSDKIRRYIVSLVFATRQPKEHGFKDLANLIEIGASPRASLALELSARANALMEGRPFVIPQDIKDVGLDVLRHRIKPTYEAEAENVKSDDMIKRIFDRVDVP